LNLENTFTELKQLFKDTENAKTGVDWMIKEVKENPGEIVIVSLGGMSNIASAIEKDPSFQNNVKHLYYMGMGHRLKQQQTTEFPFTSPIEEYEEGKVYYFYPNHNISQDTLATLICFNSNIPITVVNDAVTNKCWFTGDYCDHLRSLRESTQQDEMTVVGKLLDVWLCYRSLIFYSRVTGTCPHDPLTVSCSIYPNKFVKYVRGKVFISEWAGFSLFVPSSKGPHRIGLTIDSQGFLSWFEKQLLPNFTPKLNNSIESPSKEKESTSKEPIAEDKQTNN